MTAKRKVEIFSAGCPLCPDRFPDEHRALPSARALSLRSLPPFLLTVGDPPGADNVSDGPGPKPVLRDVDLGRGEDVLRVRHAPGPLAQRLQDLKPRREGIFR